MWNQRDYMVDGALKMGEYSDYLYDPLLLDDGHLHTTLDGGTVGGYLVDRAGGDSDETVCMNKADADGQGAEGYDHYKHGVMERTEGGGDVHNWSYEFDKALGTLLVVPSPPPLRYVRLSPPTLRLESMPSTPQEMRLPLIRSKPKKIRKRNGIFRCPECSVTFSRKDSMRRHQAAVHEQVRTFSCPVCFKCFKRQDHLKNHLYVLKKAARCRQALGIPETLPERDR